MGLPELAVKDSVKCAPQHCGCTPIQLKKMVKYRLGGPGNLAPEGLFG
jgi:hypothetical protein